MPYVEEALANIAPVSYELPDGKMLDLGGDRYKLTEPLFNGKFLADGEFPVQQLVYRSIHLCDTDIRKDLYGGIVLTGGTSLIGGFAERLHKELSELSPYKPKVVPVTMPIERRVAPWIGGSILASLGSFQQMWMSKQEFDEYGKSIVERKCP